MGRERLEQSRLAHGFTGREDHEQRLIPIHLRPIEAQWIVESCTAGGTWKHRSPASAYYLMPALLHVRVANTGNLQARISDPNKPVVSYRARNLATGQIVVLA